MAGQGIGQASFSSGELAPSLYGRVDLARYFTALKTCRNFIVRQYGGITSRPGTRYAATTKIPGKKVVLIPFQFSTTQTYVLEVGDGYTRFFWSGLPVLVSGAPVEIITPWSEIDLSALSWTQSADVLTICHTGYPPQEIRRTAHTSWTCVAFVAKGGPFREINIDESSTVFSNGVTGQVLLTSSASLFSAQDVGDLFYMEQMPDYGTPKWEVNKSYAVGVVVMAGNNFYRALTAGTSGTIRPTHLEGESSDGTTGIIWQWVHDGRGIVKIESIPDIPVLSVVSTEIQVTRELYINTSVAHGMVTGDMVLVSLNGGLQVLSYPGVHIRVLSTVQVALLNYVAPVGTPTTMTGSISIVVGTKAVATVQGKGELPARLSGYFGTVVVSGVSNSYTYVTVSTIGSHGLVAGDSILITGIVAPYIVNGKWIVSGVPTTDSFTISMWVVSMDAYTSGGVVTKYDKTLTYKWAKSAWGGDQGYPACTTYFQQRQWFAGSPGNPQGIWCSVTGAYTDFSTSLPLVDSDAITRTCKTNKVNSIRQFAPLSNLLLLTTDGPFAISGGQNGVYTPADMVLKNQGSSGCAQVMPIIIDNFCLYLQDKSSIVKAISYTWQSDTFQGQDVSKFSNHLLLGHTVLSWAYQAVPFSCLWIVRDDGALLSFTFMPEDQVMGWSRHDTTGGLFESVAVISEGQEDAVYVVVNRGGVRSVERFASRIFPGLVDAYCLDCGATYTGTPATTISGLGWLEGRTVVVVADGVQVGTKIVASGAITLAIAASKVHVGLPYTCDMETLEVASQQRDLRDKQKIINHVSLLVQESAGLMAGPDAAHLVRYVPQFGLQQSNGLISDLVDIRIPCTWNKNGRVFIRQDQPAPLTVLAIVPEVATGGS